jgi:DNA polymerase-3 subunit alpha
MLKFKQLVNPHSHSHYSLDGAATVQQILKRNAELGATHVCLTEHGNLNSAIELYTEAKKHKVKPILGIEAYVEHPFMGSVRQQLESELENESPEKREEKIAKKLRGTYVHATIHFKDAFAYQHFCRLTPAMESRAVTKFGERKPIVTWDEITQAAGHITMGSSCFIGPVQSLIYNRQGRTDPEKAERAYCMMRDLVGKDNFFVELFPHRITHDWRRPQKDQDGTIITPGQFVPIGCNAIAKDGDIQKVANQFVLEMAKKYGDRVLISLDSHFAYKAQKVTQDARLGNGQEAWKFYNCYHVMSTDECAEELRHSLGLSERDIEALVENSYRWASMFDGFKIPTSADRWVLPNIQDDWLIALKAKIDRYGRMDWNNQHMLDRLKYEIDVLAYNGKINLLSYFFTVEDMANFCRENDILMNVRGSAGGSLLLYLLGVSAVNPLKHNLSFERFLTLGRIKANTLPDVDIDISTSGRDRLLGYLHEKYGDGFCQISTDALLKLKSSIKDAERALLGHVRPETERLCKSLPQEPQNVDSRQIVMGYTDDSGHHPGLVETHHGLKQYAESNPQIWSFVSEMMGIMRQKSGHACGVVIAEEPIQNLCPVISVNGTRMTGFSPKSIEAAGLIKYDLLGLNTQDDIQRAIKSIKESTGNVGINPWDLPFDRRCVEAFARGYTVGVFQFDTATIRPFVMSIVKPEKINNLVDFIETMAAITALGRPGTLDAPYGDGRTLADVYVARANGEQIAYIHPDLEHIMKVTNGIQLYQEQTLQIFRDIGGFTYEEAETVRRGIGKKDEKVLAGATDKLRESCMARGWTEEQVKLLIDQIMASARYSFNKSHAISYAYVAYACLYMLVVYPLHWWKSVLSNATKDELASKFWIHVSQFTSLPDINHSTHEFSIVGDRLVAPLSIIGGIGEKGFAQLVQYAPYADLYDYVRKHHAKRGDGDDRSSVHVGITRKLIVTGVMDSLFENGASLSIEEKLLKFEQARAEIRSCRPEPVPDEFVGVTALGKYLIKKELINIYSEDLRPLMMPARGGQLRGGQWYTQHDVPLLSGAEILVLKEKAAAGFGFDGYYAAIAFVVKERVFSYSNKTKQATELVLDVDGTFLQDVLWPPYEGTVAQSGFSKKPVMVYFKVRKGRVSIASVVDLIPTRNVDSYNVA